MGFPLDENFMGIWLKFFAGNAGSLLEAVAEIDVDYFDGFEPGKTFADFSLHITPRDLDLLTAEACKILNSEDMSLRENLDFDGEYVDEEDRGAYIVARPWIDLWARMEPQNLDAVVASWFTLMQREYEDPEITVTEEAIRAVSDLIGICRTAVCDGCDVVHVWFA